MKASETKWIDLQDKTVKEAFWSAFPPHVTTISLRFEDDTLAIIRVADNDGLIAHVSGEDGIDLSHDAILDRTVD
jgi:hypothetical protein